MDLWTWMDKREDRQFGKEIMHSMMDNDNNNAAEERRERRRKAKAKEASELRAERREDLESGVIGKDWTDAQKVEYINRGTVPKESGLLVLPNQD